MGADAELPAAVSPLPDPEPTDESGPVVPAALGLPAPVVLLELPAARVGPWAPAGVLAAPLLQAAANMARRRVAPQQAARLERVGIVVHLLRLTLVLSTSARMVRAPAGGRIIGDLRW